MSGKRVRMTYETFAAKLQSILSYERFAMFDKIKNLVSMMNLLLLPCNLILLCLKRSICTERDKFGGGGG